MFVFVLTAHHPFSWAWGIVWKRPQPYTGKEKRLYITLWSPCNSHFPMQCTIDCKMGSGIAPAELRAQCESALPPLCTPTQHFEALLLVYYCTCAHAPWTCAELEYRLMATHCHIKLKDPVCKKKKKPCHPGWCSGDELIGGQIEEYCIIVRRLHSQHSQPHVLFFFFFFCVWDCLTPLYRN